MAARHYGETANFDIPLFTKLRFDLSPSAKPNKISRHSVSVLSSLFWHTSLSFYQISQTAFYTYGGLPSATSPEHLLQLYEHHEMIVQEAKATFSAGALAKLEPENAKEIDRRVEREDAEEFRQTQLALVQEYCSIQREMFEWEADITFQAFCDLFQWPYEYKRTLTRMQKDFFYYERWFKGKRGHARIAEIKPSLEPQYHIMLWIDHPMMKKAAEKKREADTGLDIVHDMLFELREWKEQRDESARVANQKFYENIAQMRKSIMLKQAAPRRQVVCDHSKIS